MKKITTQEREDFLKTMYSMKRQGNRIIKTDITCRLRISVQRATRIMEDLIREGYLYKDENRHLYLTQIGLHKGRECLERFRNIERFLQLTAGVDAELAAEKACAIEHILGEEVCMGIRIFLERKHTWSYAVRGNDLNTLFEYGWRIMPCAIYTKGSKNPRILAREHFAFQNKVNVDIAEESVLYLRPKEEALLEKEMVYRMEDTWYAASKNERGFGILTEALECTLRHSNCISEGKVEISLLENKEDAVAEERICILTVSLI